MNVNFGSRRRITRWIGVGTFLAGFALSAAEPALKDMMRFKLHYAQGVLEGITTESFPLVATNANRLIQLAKASEWKVRSTPEYERFTTDFIRSAEALDKAAQRQRRRGFGRVFSADRELRELSPASPGRRGR